MHFGCMRTINVAMLISLALCACLTEKALAVNWKSAGNWNCDWFRWSSRDEYCRSTEHQVGTKRVNKKEPKRTWVDNFVNNIETTWKSGIESRKKDSQIREEDPVFSPAFQQSHRWRRAFRWEDRHRAKPVNRRWARGKRTGIWDTLNDCTNVHRRMRIV